MGKKKIYVFGSCRVQAAARNMYYIAKKSNNALKIQVLNKKDVLLHSTKEILNIISPSTPACFSQYLTMCKAPVTLIKNADIFLIEISSRKCRLVEYEGRELFFKEYGNKVPDSKVIKITSAQIRKDIFRISSILKKPIVFISTFNLNDNFNNPVITSKDVFSKLIKSCAIASGNLFFDPSIYMQKNLKIYQNVNGDELPIEDLSVIDRRAGKIYVKSEYVDSVAYHYTEAGEKLIGEKLKCFLMENKLI
jgi:hypothetical protein